MHYMLLAIRKRTEKNSPEKLSVQNFTMKIISGSAI